jgi:uncharacterized protein (TIGR03382 family)
MPTNRFLTGCALTVAVASCGSVSGIPIDKTATDFAQAICPMAYSCCTMDQLMGNSAAGTTEQECEMKTAANFRNQLQTMQTSENAGRSKYDQTKVDACLAAIRAATCSKLQMIHSLSQIEACNSTFTTPLVAAGDKCQQDFECIGGVCQRPMGSFDGVCVAGNAAGATCTSSDNRCASSLICDGRGTMDTGDDVCVAEQENGASCVDGFDCKSRNCVADGTTGAKTCQAVSGPQCFYGGGCSAAGGRPGVAALCVMGLFALVVMMRARRARARSRAQS